MICAWQEFLKLLPFRMRKEIDELGQQNLQEVRLRIGQVPKLITGIGVKEICHTVTQDDLNFVVNTASQYSPWAASTLCQGYITASGGHRIGICGDTVNHNGRVSGIRTVTSLCLRVARDIPGLAKGTESYSGSILIIGPPGAGKTTLLRDLIRKRGESGKGNVSVIDERGEIFPQGQGKNFYDTGQNTDIITGCSKQDGINMVLRTMSPSSIAVDEITSAEDCAALLLAGWCGVSLLATAHASNRDDLYRRPVYSPLTESRIFDTLLVLSPNKTWNAERI